MIATHSYGVELHIHDVKKHPTYFSPTTNPAPLSDKQGVRYGTRQAIYQRMQELGIHAGSAAEWRQGRLRLGKPLWNARVRELSLRKWYYAL